VPTPIYKLGEISRLAKENPLLRDALPILEEVSTAAGKWHDTHESHNCKLHMRNWWKPCLTVIGIEGLPEI